MHYLVTGGSGFIGQHLCRRLRLYGHAVSVLTRDSQRTERILDLTLTVVDSLTALAIPVDVVINLAGANLVEQRWTQARKTILINSRVQSTIDLVDWISAQTRRPSVLVSGSAIGWYGTDRADQVLTEESAPGHDFPAKICQRWEEEAMRAESYGVRVCCVRTGVVLGVAGGVLSKMIRPFKLGLGGPIGTGRQWISWIAMPDMIQVLCWLAENECARGAYNATSPNPVRNGDFVCALGDALHRPAFVRAPVTAIRAMFGEMSDVVLKGQNVVPARLTSEGFSFSYPKLAAALSQSLVPN